MVKESCNLIGGEHDHDHIQLKPLYLPFVFINVYRHAKSPIMKVPYRNRLSRYKGFNNAAIWEHFEHAQVHQTKIQFKN